MICKISPQAQTLQVTWVSIGSMSWLRRCTQERSTRSPKRLDFLLSCSLALWIFSRRKRKSQMWATCSARWASRQMPTPSLKVPHAVTKKPSKFTQVFQQESYTIQIKRLFRSPTTQSLATTPLLLSVTSQCFLTQIRLL